MTNFTSTWTAHSLNFANRIARRVVMMHITSLTVGNFHSVNQLRITKRRQSHNIHPLSHATRKQARAVSTRQESNFRTERTDLCQLSTIRTNSLSDNSPTNIFMQSQSKCFIIIATNFAIFFLVQSQFFRHRLMELSANFANHFIALWIRATDFLTKFPISPRVNCLLN